MSHSNIVIGIRGPELSVDLVRVVFIGYMK
jgi:hypothetical protein